MNYSLIRKQHKANKLRMISEKYEVNWKRLMKAKKNNNVDVFNRCTEIEQELNRERVTVERDISYRGRRP